MRTNYHHYLTAKIRTGVAFSICLIVGLFEARAQVHNAVKINLLSLPAKTISGSYERAVGERWSVQLNALYTREINPPWTYITIRGYGVTPEVRFYTQREKQAFEGLYLGSFLRYRHNFLTLRDSNRDSFQDRRHFVKNTFGAGFLVGYQLLLKNKKISLDFFGGPHLSHHVLNPQTSAQGYNFNETFFIRPLAYRIGATIGYAFR